MSPRSCRLFVVYLMMSVVAALPDWIVTRVDIPTVVTNDGNILKLSNGLLSKSFIQRPGFAAIDFYCHEKRASLLRALEPEAVITLDGIRYEVGGVRTNVSRAYMNRTALANDLRPNPQTYQFVGYDTKSPEAPYPYKPKRGVPDTLPWPLPGVHLTLNFAAPASAPPLHKKISVKVHYEMYDGIPMVAKWIAVEPSSASVHPLEFVSFEVVESLALNRQWLNWMHLEADLPSGRGPLLRSFQEPNAEPGSFQPKVVFAYDGQVLFPIINEKVESFRVFELLTGTEDPERVGLSKRRMTRRLAPQTMETPIFFHLTEADNIRWMADQAHAVGFDMIILSFGSGFDLEATANNKTRLYELRDDVAYANSKGVEVGAYDLIGQTRVVAEKWLAVNEDPFKSACLASGWYDYLLERIVTLVEVANLTAVEADGTYSGYKCSSNLHQHHFDELDSVYRNSQRQGQLFVELQKRGVFVNQPERYFFKGGSKTAMGYNEAQYSLPRWMDLSVSRQGMFDDTFHYLPSQGWMFLPLVQYQGGGAAAAFEPLEEHLKAYEWGLAQYFGAGVQACYRGYRLFDCDETERVVKKWVDFYKKYRSILNGDLIHVKRADMQGLDAFLHVPDAWLYDGPYKGLVMIFNPSGVPTLERLEDDSCLEIPLYYTGLTDEAVVTFEGNESTRQVLQLSRDYKISVNVSLEPESLTWLLIQ